MTAALTAAASQAVDVVLVGAGGEYMDSAVVLEWKAAPGDPVTAGETLVVVETAKAATEIDAPVSGVLSLIAAETGAEVAVGGLLGRIDPAASAGTSADNRPAALTPATASPRLALAGASTDRRSGLPLRWPRAFATPLAKRIALEHGVDLGKIAGTGPHQRIVRADVLAAVNAPAARSGALNVPTRGDGYRRAMAQHMARAAGVPSFSIAMDCDGTNLMALRARVKAAGGRASLNDLILHAVAQTLKHHRRVNARWDGEGVAFSEAINLGVAVATDLGLVVPVLRDADRLSSQEIAAEVSRLRLKAESQALGSQDIAGGTFTVSNLGSFGVASFTATLNPPQAAILAVPAFKRVVVFDDGRLESRPTARLSLTADHRVLDGADAARFLADLCRRLENPEP